MIEYGWKMILSTGKKDFNSNEDIQQIMYITDDQKLLIEAICDVNIDSDMSKIYKCNDLIFKIHPNLEKNEFISPTSKTK